MSPSHRTDHRAAMPVRVFRLGEEPRDELSTTMSAAERVEMVIILSARMLELSGVTPPAYSREQIPVRVIRPE